MECHRLSLSRKMDRRKEKPDLSADASLGHKTRIRREGVSFEFFVSAFLLPFSLTRKYRIIFYPRLLLLGVMKELR